MKTKFLFTVSLAAICCLALTITSCLDDVSFIDDESEEAELTSMASLSENESDDILEVVSQVELSIDGNQAGRMNELCAVVTNNTENKILTIDFGTGCTGPYGRTRSGKIIVAYSGEINDNVSNRIITFENYVVNNKGVSGSMELRDITFNIDGSVSSTKKLVALKITFPNGQFVSYTGNRTRRWTDGVLDGDPTNNVFVITGSVEGTWSNGRTFTHIITEPVVSNWACAATGGFARVSGEVEVQRLGGYINRKRITRYGDGTCDNTITVIIGTREFVITEVED